MFSRKNRKHPNVGRMFWSDYFKRDIIVTSFKDDDNWHFRFHGEVSEFKAGSKLSYFENMEDF